MTVLASGTANDEVSPNYALFYMWNFLARAFKIFVEWKTNEINVNDTVVKNAAKLGHNVNLLQ